jgi:hypothetical protein
MREIRKNEERNYYMMYFKVLSDYFHGKTEDIF